MEVPYVDGTEYQLIELTKGHYALIDDADYDLVSQHTWHVTDNGVLYARTRFWDIEAQKTTMLYMHRLILPTKLEVDHINRNGLDNRRANLREVNRTENNRNRRFK